MLELEDVEAAYGKIRVLWGVSLRVAERETVAIVGANGAGKTTLLRTIAGLLRPSAGRITFNGRDIAGLPAHAVARRGLALVPEGREIFPRMSVADNLLLGGRLCRDPARRRRNFARVLEVFPVLAERRRQPAATLSGGEQQMLAIARGLMAEPSLLLLDEPSTGLSPLVVESIFDVIGRLAQEGTTTLLVEQNVQFALGVADRAYVLERGRVVLDGRGRDLLEHPAIRRAYLGLASP